MLFKNILKYFETNLKISNFISIKKLRNHHPTPRSGIKVTKFLYTRQTYIFMSIDIIQKFTLTIHKCN